MNRACKKTAVNENKIALVTSERNEVKYANYILVEMDHSLPKVS